MTDYDVITLRGIGEPRDDRRMCANLTRQLGARFHVREFLPWSGEFAGPDSYEGIVRVTAMTLVESIKAARRKVVLVGFSAGSDIIGLAIRMLDPDTRKRIAYVVLAADPSMPSSFYLSNSVVGTTRPGGCGIRGPRPVWLPCPVVWLSSAGDVICQCSPRSPIRSLALFLTTALARVTPSTQSFYDKLRDPSPLTDIDRSPESYWAAAVDLDGYLRRGEHVRPYPAMLDSVGRRINALP